MGIRNIREFEILITADSNVFSQNSKPLASGEKVPHHYSIQQTDCFTQKPTVVLLLSIKKKPNCSFIAIIYRVALFLLEHYNIM